MELGGALGVQRETGLTAPRIRYELTAALADSFCANGLPDFGAASQADEHHNILVEILVARIEFAARSHPSASHNFSSTRYGL